MNIYSADGLLDRQRVMDQLAELLAQTDAAVKTIGWASARVALNSNLTVLLDEVSDGFVRNPLDAPDMTIEYINACRPVGSATPPLKLGD